MQLQTCVNDGTGNCSGSPTSFGVNRSNPFSTGTAFKNCSDPTTSSGTECVYYSYPGDSFSQVGDFKWVGESGHTAAFYPQSTTSSMYKPGVVPLISHVSSLNTGLIGTPSPYTGTASASATAARAMIDTELTSRNIKDNTAGKANVLYLAGHDQSGTVAGTKIMMETLLQLGLSTLPPITVTTEVSRNSPIAVTIDDGSGPAANIVQGTFEFVAPVPTVPTFGVDADAATFTFPYLKGHLRGRLASTITTVSDTFGGDGITFDAAAGIPTAIYTGSGCGSNYFTASCRTVFTTTGTGTTTQTTRTYLNEDNILTLGPLMGSGLTAANQGVLVQRVLAGDDSSIPGFYKPALGGVDCSTVAVIGASSVVPGIRPTMAYFGAADGMLHAVCMELVSPCTSIGQELWAYLPRVSLSTVRYNTARIDGSPHVIDAYGDFTASGQRSWRTLLMFQTGAGDTSSNDRKPAVYAIDISDSSDPTVLWEYALADTGSLNAYELGVGLTLAAGRVQTGTVAKYYAFAQTNNAGSAGGGNVVTAIDTETGTAAWQIGYQFATSLRTGGATVPSATGIPGGAVAVDKTGQGYVSDVVFGTLYGDLWEVDPKTGASRYGSGPLFRFSTDYHPIGAKPAIYDQGGIQYAVVATGGYVEKYPNDTTWNPSGTTNYALGVSLNTPTADAIIDENKGSPDIGFKFSLGSGERAIAQATVVGNQVFITTDTADTNNNTDPGGYGTGGATGHVYNYNVSSGTQGTTVVVEGGASSVINSGTGVYAGASDQTQRLASDATTINGTEVNPAPEMKVSRKLWLRTQ